MFPTAPYLCCCTTYENMQVHIYCKLWTTCTFDFPLVVQQHIYFTRDYYYMHFVGNVFPFPVVKELWKLVKMCQSYDHLQVVHFLRHRVVIVLVSFYKLGAITLKSWIVWSVGYWRCKSRQSTSSNTSNPCNTTKSFYMRPIISHWFFLSFITEITSQYFCKFN